MAILPAILPAILQGLLKNQGSQNIPKQSKRIRSDRGQVPHETQALSAGRRDTTGIFAAHEPTPIRPQHGG